MPKASLKTFKIMISLIIAGYLSGCAVMSKKECISADWQRVGYSVGANGNRAASRAFLEREKVCAKHGTVANRKAFMQGHEFGIDEFCDPYNAVKHGIDGRTSTINQKICPEQDYPGFTGNFWAGYKLHLLNQDVYEAQSYVSSLEGRRAKYRRRIRSLREASRDSETSSSQRQSYEKQCNSLEYQVREISYDIRRKEDLVYKLQSKARRYRDYLDSEYLDPVFEPASRLP